jgi:pilus assembly protein CpaB
MRQAFALIISIALGLLAVFAMKNYIAQEKKSSVQKIDMVEVLFSKRHLPPKTVLQRSDVYPSFLPSGSVTPDMVKPHEFIEINGLSVHREVNRGGPLFHSDFLSTQRKYISEVQKGRRLISIAVNQISGVSGLIRPGQRVDILYSTVESSFGAAKGQSQTVMLLENVSVHATDDKTVDIPLAFNQKRAGYSTVTFSVTPTEAVILTNASRQGVITLALRSKDDFTPSALKGNINDKNLLDSAKRANAERWKKIKGN